ncbi:ankyrin repeat domain-containing protein 6-like protein [Leptotrombidium deliense]|uniref:Ankyrin repeat domain-containing protein 6-like protein n=1 Tax=Leptotrombidium deliense TaxID=299467 RepID=A0A443SW91_9ACAR|nr:ankyrin repeat domain-containing protein 6-like protein [Leptotrombidium deliense]
MGTIDRQRYHGNTSVHEAAWKGYSQTIEVLCKHQANLQLRNKLRFTRQGGFSPLHLVCQQGHNQSCRVLLLNSSSPDLKNNYGDTPVHTAARYGHAGVVRILISAFCNVNDVNKNGDTALHISSAMGRRKLTKILLESGCDATIKNKFEYRFQQQGETAMDIALRKSFKEVQEILTNPPAVIERPISLKNNRKSKDGSQASKNSHHKEKKYSKSKTSAARNVHFRSDKNAHDSPYGCPLYPDMTDFPQPKLDSLPTEPLKKGEQYYVDLAGNIRKGPVGKVFNCYCVPIFEKKKTSNQLITLQQTVKQKLANERTECANRNNRRSLKDRLEFERRQQEQVEQFKGEMRSWLENKLASPENEVIPDKHSLDTETINLDNVNGGIQENVPETLCDRPKSCLGLINKQNNRHEPEVTIPTSIIRSKSEVHLREEVNGNNEKQSTNGYMNVCNGVITTHAKQSQNDTHIDIEKNMPELQTTERITDLMRSLRCDGSHFVPHGDYRNSPCSDSGYRTKFSPSPKECHLPTAPTLHKRSPIYNHRNFLSRSYCSSLNGMQKISTDNTTLMSKNSSLV